MLPASKQRSDYKVIYLLARSLGLFAVVLHCSVGVASQEMYLPWCEVRIVSDAPDDAGQVEIVASTNSDLEWKSVEVSAFGQKYKLDPKQLTSLKGYDPSSLVISYEPGYQELGGHTVHWALSRTFLNKNENMTQKMIISVYKRKGLALRERDAVAADPK